MCGFVAFVGTDGRPAEPAVIERMREAIVHRGPDDAGIYIDGPVGLGFRRLSILDLSHAGHQPMESADGSLAMVYNGEIYNYVELRDELVALGHEFRSTGDSEVLLHAYQEWGADCLSRLNGMWAMLIYDRRRRVVFGSRDRFGIKPLFLYRAPGQTLLASEIKALRASGVIGALSPNWQVSARYLTRGLVDCNSETFFKDIEQIPPGHAFELSLDGEFRRWRYWSIPNEQLDPTEDPAETFAELFEDSVRLRMRSDVPIGVCLSGGLDSTSIICAMARNRADPTAERLHAFCYADPNYDESRYIEATLEQTKAELNSLESDGRDFWDAAQEVLRFHDEPFHTLTAIIGYRLMGMIRDRNIKVVLNGQGADESLGGYPHYFRIRWLSLARRLRIARLVREVRDFADGQDVAAGPLLGCALRAGLQSRLGGCGAYRALAAHWRKHGAFWNPWLTPDVNGHMDEFPDTAFCSLTDALAGGVTTTPLPLYLRIEDRNSMAHSVEARLPFMDYRLISFAFSLPDDWKLYKPWNKYVLRAAMTGRIPEIVRARVDKMGFSVSQHEMFAGPLYEPMQDLLASRSFVERGIYNVERIRADLERHRAGEARLGHDLFRIAQFELWSRIRIDGDEAAPAPAPAPEPSYA